MFVSEACNKAWSIKVLVQRMGDGGCRRHHDDRLSELLDPFVYSGLVHAADGGNLILSNERNDVAELGLKICAVLQRTEAITACEFGKVSDITTVLRLDACDMVNGLKLLRVLFGDEAGDL
jgi:hypothetical protein